MRRILTILSLVFVLTSCSNVLQVTVSDDVINSDYIGNGAEWDPYDEVKSWGYELTDEDWNELYARVGLMSPGYVRCMINSPFTYYDNGNYDKNRNTENLVRLLSFCQEKDVYVIFGEYNPPTWEMKESQEWIDMSVDFLNHLVIERGFTCIKNFVIFNEPDGNWSCTDGDYDLWLSVLRRFDSKMGEYPDLREAVRFAGPDAVINYQNGKFDTAGWISNAAKDAGDIIDVYDVHSYPSQAQVHDGSYFKTLKEVADLRPEGKKILLGEAGYKYASDPRDLPIWNEYNRRLKGHPFTKGSDCNMLVYDYFYGLDMPLLAIEAMNAGFSGLAVWMLDDAMHTNGDSGKTEDLKIWGMWNTVGETLFGKPEETEIRPWYYSWTLMCRHFPKGCDILSCSQPEVRGVRYSAAIKEDKLSFAAVNVTEKPYSLCLSLPKDFEGEIFLYNEEKLAEVFDGNSIFAKAGEQFRIELPAQSLIMLSERK